MPLVKPIKVPVALAAEEPNVVVVNGNAKLVAEQSAPVPETTPLTSWRHCVPVIPEMTRFVVDAVPVTVIAVDEAYGNCEATLVEVALK